MSARSLNKVLLIGNLTRDPELRYTPQGTAVCSFGLATNRSWVPSEGGEKREETEFHRIVAWNKLAELCNQLLSKGRKVYVEGRLQTRTWEGQDGQKRQATEVVIENMIVLDSRGRPEGGQEVQEEVQKEEKPRSKKASSKEAEPKSEEPASEKATDVKEDEDINLDDIPF
ncbi:MAG TPA: single-stranded DNA-binding protein [Patescibacteria group bacterium]|nr:single-stranded DNA-binding protein [Patescibacteria group bacterium]